MNILKDKVFLFCGVIPTVLLLSWMGYETFSELTQNEAPRSRDDVVYNENDEFARKLHENHTHDNVITIPVNSP